MKPLAAAVLVAAAMLALLALLCVRLSERLPWSGLE